jgi:hypothetical protein
MRDQNHPWNLTFHHHCFQLSTMLIFVLADVWVAALSSDRFFPLFSSSCWVMDAGRQEYYRPLLMYYQQ